MKNLVVERRAVDFSAYKMRSAIETDCGTLISESVSFWCDGKNTLNYIEREELPEFNLQELVGVVRGIEYNETFRTAGMKTRSRIFGYMPRNVLRKDYCAPTKLVNEAPNKHGVIVGAADWLDQVYLSVSRETYERHREMSDLKVLPEYRLGRSVFTSGIINYNNPLRYHFDTGNYRGVWSAMITLKHQIIGGYLALPEYDVMLELKHGSVLLFDGQGILHGVTPFQTLSKDAFRYTLVFYSLLGMWKCQTITEELARIRNLKTQRERKRIKT